MKLGVLVSEFRNVDSTLMRLKADKLGIILVGNGVYHCTVKENSKKSPLLESFSDIYVLSEDLQTRGFSGEAVDSKVKQITYGDLVDMVFNEYEKLIWI